MKNKPIHLYAYGVPRRRFGGKKTTKSAAMFYGKQIIYSRGQLGGKKEANALYRNRLFSK